MSIPMPAGAADDADDEAVWAQLDASGKRERLLAAAGEVFACEGIEAPMPSIAAAAGAGVGSVYRQFPSKEGLLAALVVRRLETVLADIEIALAEIRESGAWEAFEKLLWHLADRQASDDVVAEAMATVSDHPEVAAWSLRCEQRLEELMGTAREQGTLRSDAGPADVRLLLAAVRSTRRRDPASWRRMLELGIAGLARCA